MLPIFNDQIQLLRRRAENRRLILHRRRLRDHSDPFDIPDNRFIELYRLNREAALYVLNTIYPHIKEGVYNNSIPNNIKYFAALRLYATGTYQRDIGLSYKISLSQTSVHRCIRQVTQAIELIIAPQEISFPRDPAEQHRIKEVFMNKFGFPGILGCVDGTHIAILKPIQEGHNFYNRKGYHSLNVMIICDANLKVLTVNANYPGSNHDSFIWRQSNIRDYLLQEFFTNRLRGSWLLGDSGYMLEPIVMTPFLNPLENSPEARYNWHHIRARNTVERSIGVLKNRFRVLLQERTARYAPAVVGSLVKACAALHNICMRFKVPFLHEILEENEPVMPFQIDNAQREFHRQGNDIRNNIVNRYFRV